MGDLKLQPVILSGGKGTRLWPLCTPQLPKPFLPVFDGSTLLQQTAERAEPFGAPLVVTQHGWVEQTQAQLPTATILAEPDTRNTAASIALAALHVAQHNPKRLLWIMPADHVIEDSAALHMAVERAAPLAEQGDIITFGISPTHPDTAYGYIQTDALLGAGYRIAHFHEKPTLRCAEDYMLQGNCYWNSGMFLASAQALLEAYAQHAPALLALCAQALEGSAQKERALYVAQHYARAEMASFDVAIMEKHPHSAMVPLTCGWSDIGTWPKLLMHLEGQAGAWEPRPWGRYRQMLQGEGWMLKEVVVQPHARLSLQRHAHRSEHWLVLSGTAHVVCGEFAKMLQEGEGFFVPQGAQHRLGNPTDTPCHIVEIQAGELLSEADIERFDDDFGRR